MLKMYGILQGDPGYGILQFLQMVSDPSCDDLLQNFTWGNYPLFKVYLSPNPASFDQFKFLILSWNLIFYKANSNMVYVRLQNLQFFRL